MLGIFDSGLGGLHFTSHINALYPEIDTLYLGDQLRLPYGGRSRDAIQTFTEECVLTLFSKGATMVILACNTASAESLRYLQQKYPHKKILGILIPGVEAALENNGSIGIVATRATVAIKAYTKEIQKRDPERKVIEVAAPLLVPFIEEKEGKSPSCRHFIKKYVRKLKDARVHSVILGCTHYPSITSVFKSILHTSMKIIDPGKEAAIKLQAYFERHPDMYNRISKEHKRYFYTTDIPEKLLDQSRIFYPGKPIHIEKIYTPPVPL